MIINAFVVASCHFVLNFCKDHIRHMKGRSYIGNTFSINLGLNSVFIDVSLKALIGSIPSGDVCKMLC